MMARDTQSKILTIDEQIKKLKEKRTREIAKLERYTGKKFLSKFNLEEKSSEEINVFIDRLYEFTKENLKEDSAGDPPNEQSNK
ncbi:hypothetical protein ABES38_08830 [Bacillus gobiensis]|uniref:hypothetical protein n=1 Tax=Bacillus gobiensis TaxID=1441095 RepID=UPI003D1D7A49